MAELLRHSAKLYSAPQTGHQEGFFIGFKPRRLDTLEANKEISKTPSRWKHMFFRLLAKDAKLHQEFFNRLVRPGIRHKAIHLREDAAKGVRLKIIPQGPHNHLHFTASHEGAPARIVHTNLSRGGTHMQNQ